MPAITLIDELPLCINWCIEHFMHWHKARQINPVAPSSGKIYDTWSPLSYVFCLLSYCMVTSCWLHKHNTPWLSFLSQHQFQATRQHPSHDLWFWKYLDVPCAVHPSPCCVQPWEWLLCSLPTHTHLVHSSLLFSGDMNSFLPKSRHPLRSMCLRLVRSRSVQLSWSVLLIWSVLPMLREHWSFSIIVTWFFQEEAPEIVCLEEVGNSMSQH